MSPPGSPHTPPLPAASGQPPDLYHYHHHYQQQQQQQHAEHERNLAMQRHLADQSGAAAAAGGGGGGGGGGARSAPHAHNYSGLPGTPCAHQQRQPQQRHPFQQQNGDGDGGPAAAAGGGGSSDQRSKSKGAAVADERAFVDLLKQAHGWDIVQMGDDGACLFRAVGESVSCFPSISSLSLALAFSSLPCLCRDLLALSVLAGVTSGVSLLRHGKWVSAERARESARARERERREREKCP